MASDKATSLIRNVSDTARWVAALRAAESRRSDALFRDPLAERLSGQAGRDIARSMSGSGGVWNGWPIVTRTKILDDMVMESIAEGCTSVLNLAAGLDTRPYRLAVPASLRWIEADFSGIVEEKARALEGERPRCEVERVAVDLSDEAARRTFFDRVDAQGSRTLVITEGLVMYLDRAVVASLARDLAARPHFASWTLDFVGPAILKILQTAYRKQLAHAPMTFAPEDGVAFFEALGWRADRIVSLFHEGARLRRVPCLMRPFAWFPAPDPRSSGSGRASFVVKLARAA